MKANFGVGGFPPKFYESDYRFSRYGKRREGIFPWLASLGLNWLELECTYGVKMPHSQATDYKRVADENGIGMSIHAPYYCVLCSANPETVKRSKQDLIKAFGLAAMLGVNRIVFHPGHPCRDDRTEALDMIVDALNTIKLHRPDGLVICPEVGGKKKQLGSLDDLIYICDRIDYARPCLDLAHLHAREGGSLTSSQAIVDRLNYIESKLGRAHLEEGYFHVYPVTVNDHGEKEHCAFFDAGPYYPLAEHFIEAIKVKGIVPTVVCEAKNSQEHGAMLMKKLYEGQPGGT